MTSVILFLIAVSLDSLKTHKFSYSVGIPPCLISAVLYLSTLISYFLRFNCQEESLAALLHQRQRTDSEKSGQGNAPLSFLMLSSCGTNVCVPSRIILFPPICLTLWHVTVRTAALQQAAKWRMFFYFLLFIPFGSSLSSLTLFYTCTKSLISSTLIFSFPLPVLSPQSWRNY